MLTDWFCNRDDKCYTSRYELGLSIEGITFVLKGLRIKLY